VVFKQNQHPERAAKTARLIIPALRKGARLNRHPFKLLRTLTDCAIVR
jgi:hypothetical protein